MNYTVLTEFADLQDNSRIYKAGDVYPRSGYMPSAERLNELSTAKNLLHKPLIQEIPEPEPKPETEPEQEPEQEPEPEQTPEPEAVEKPKRAKK